ncbi:DUF4270 domain-containing protein [Mangrovimonas spongiae]|uniref:DUF4270 domain-containing protein n=1 Tax=Mangrovimonas spongiae TaxID=2494697 RepID=A0A3R9UWN6_9FLAO|nr:DUF4270 domain-containing protein [Mangrovimonas spongiae]RSK41699.1 DUF4270 domain-containing protein [Mangrovimonas spongiae]
MKKFTQILKPALALVILAITFIACDKDYTSLESDIQGVQNFDVVTEKFPVTAYNQKMGPVQTDNLSSNLLGVYNDPIYGKTTASIVTQLVPTSNNFNPDFGENPQLVSVKLHIPFFNTITGTNEEGSSSYATDSIFGNNASPIKLSIHRINYFLRDYTPDSDFSEEEIYFSNSNQTINFDNHLLEMLYTNNFTPEISEDFVEEAPGLNLDLNDENIVDPDFWATTFFLNQDSPKLSNANNFKDFFRGLYFKVETIGSEDGHMMMLDFNNNASGITIEYTNNDTEEDETLEYNLSFINVNRLNILENDPTNTVIDDASDNADQINGDNTLYLKGGEGSYSIITLFENQTSFEDFKTDFVDNDGNPKKLINEASISFYVNQNIVNGKEPDRILLYDLKNNTPVVDYYYDGTTSTQNPLFSKNYFSRVLERDNNNNGVKYKVNLTEHLNNILLRDSTNVELGLFITTNINEVDNVKILNQENFTSTGTIISPRGTAIYGSNANVPEDKRLQLEINYTDPNQ